MICSFTLFREEIDLLFFKILLILIFTDIIMTLNREELSRMLGGREIGKHTHSIVVGNTLDHSYQLIPFKDDLYILCMKEPRMIIPGDGKSFGTLIEKDKPSYFIPGLVLEETYMHDDTETALQSTVGHIREGETSDVIIALKDYGISGEVSIRKKGRFDLRISRSQKLLGSLLFQKHHLSLFQVNLQYILN